MERMIWLPACLAIAALCGCSSEDWQTARSTEVTPDDPLPGQPAYCDGICVATPPATYTGPSLFWIGAPALVEGCPPETPDQGIEGYVLQPMPLLFARECRVTPSDLCSEEGQTCAPLPRPEFHVCIHRVGDAPCPADYEEHTEMEQTGDSSKVTVCCQKALLPG
ncbi:MAG: hypothetical protein U0441_11295 [Polyangiaceae bacterium]